MVALGWRREQANGNGRARRRGGRDERPLCQTVRVMIRRKLMLLM